ncbi:FCD domain-containing protein [Agrobacterium deltaense]|uniref:FCD domain-containing protein n=1 Tax=Agrobacterium deltaense TaxID=1183412 RepID=UPI003D972999
MNGNAPSRPQRAADTVARHIETLILEGSLRPGVPLLPERELALKLNVSRPTLRDALQSLEKRGFLTSREGKGVKVAQIGATTITDPLIAMLSERSEVADDYLEFRDVVESSAAAMAAQRANEPEIQRIKECVLKIEAAHKANNPIEEADADAEMHIAIYEASHNLVILQIMRALSENLRTDVLHNRRRLFAIPYVRDLLRDQHIAIAQAIIDKKPEAARSAAHEHLSYLRQASREIREAEEKLDISLRRLESGGLSTSKS